MERAANNPKRRIAPQGAYDTAALSRKVRYIGSAHHKKYPADYDFDPPVAPRPNKSVCDSKRIIKRQEAFKLLLAGVSRGVMSTFSVKGLPKYILAVDENGDVYEAKLDAQGYHGYRLRSHDDRAMRRIVTKAWKFRCGEE
jgi:hypothetical protein